MANLKFATTVFAGVVLFLNSVAFAQQDAQETIKKAIEAHGGKEALVKAQQFKRTSSGTIFFGQTQNFTDELIVSLPTKIKLNIKLDTKENLLMCLEGDTGWSIASGFPIDLSKEKIVELKEESFLCADDWREDIESRALFWDLFPVSSTCVQGVVQLCAGVLATNRHLWLRVDNVSCGSLIGECDAPITII